MHLLDKGWNALRGEIFANQKKLGVIPQNANLTKVVKESQNSAGYQYMGIVSKQKLTATSTSWKWQTKAETAGTTVNADELAIAVLQLGATPAASARRRYMVLAG